jgi:hypothetical protein
VSNLRDKARFKEKLQEVASAFRASLELASLAYVGAEFSEPLEHVTRRHLIDIILIALGWNLDQQGLDILEEAQTKGETTLFLDYLGVNPDSRAPLVIVEAKAWAKPFVSPSAATIDRSGARNAMDGGPSLIARAVDHVNKGEEESSSPVTLEWTRWIAKLRDYMRTVHTISGYCVQRVVITSGQWLVIFCNPAAAFLEDGAATDPGILCFCSDELIERSDQIHDLLARETLIRDPPERLRPTQLTAYLTPSDVAHVFCALWIVHRIDGAHWDVHPQLTLYAALVIQRGDGLLVTVVDDGPRLCVPYNMNDLGEHAEAVAGNAENLLQAVNQELNLSAVPSDIEKFPGFGASADELPAPGLSTPE